jgi:preprotein translocase subunit SecD
VGAAFVDFWPHPSYRGITNPFPYKLGLDLRGGASILLVPDPNQHYTKTEVDNAIGTTLTQIEKRVNGGLGVSEATIRILTDSQNNKSISLDLPGLNSGNLTANVASLLRPGNLEFWDTGQTPLAENTPLDPTQYTQYNPGGKPQFTGKDLDSNQISVGSDPQTGQIVINFEMQGPAIARFGDFIKKIFIVLIIAIVKSEVK